MKIKRLLALVAISVMVFGGVTVIVLRHLQSSDANCTLSPGGGCVQLLRPANKPSYKTADNYFLIDTASYQCSRPVKLVSNTVNNDGDYVNYQPVDKNESRVLCHATSVIEFKGKLKVLQKPKVVQLIAKYHYIGVSVKAVEFKYIKDKDFVHRLLPTYADREIGCIIVLETPHEKLVYLEDEQLNTFEALDYQTFEQYLNAVSPADRQTFLDNLK